MWLKTTGIWVYLLFIALRHQQKKLGMSDPRCSGGRDQEELGFRPTQTKEFSRPPSQQEILAVVACTCHPSDS
jgi:hypothetical protein